MASNFVYRDGEQSFNLGQAPSGFGSMYDQLFAANPYRNLQYHKSGWQEFLEMLGFRTSADDWLEQQQTNINEYDAGIFSLMQQNKFNSPSAQAQRMRDAGLNPDLQGIGDVAQAAQPTEDPNGMQPTGASDAEQFGSTLVGFAKGIYSVFMAGLSFANNMTSIKQMETVIDGQNIANAKSMMSAIDEMIFGSIPAEDVDSNDSTRFAASLNALASNVPDFRSMGFSERQIYDAENHWRSRVFSLANDSKLRTAAYERYKAMSDSNKIRSEGFYSGDSEMEEEVMGIFIDTMSSLARDVYEKESSNKLASANVKEGKIINEGIESNIETQRLDALQDVNYGKIEADLQVQQARSAYDVSTNEGTQARLSNLIASCKEEQYKALKAAADRGNYRAQAVLYMMVIQDFAQFDISGGFDMNLLKGIASIASRVLGGKSGYTDTTGSNLSKNFGFGADVHIGVKTK